jgi:NADH-quinone oxidoreductase subunit E
MVTETRTGNKPGYAVIDAIIYKHNVQPGGIMPVLQEIQDEYGYVPPGAIYHIAQSMNINASEIYGILTFYSQFRLKPIGKNLVKVCHGTACHLNGAEKVASALAQKTGANEGETSPDGMFTVERVACLGCCSLAPCISINNEVHGKLSADGISNVVSQYNESAKVAPVD